MDIFNGEAQLDGDRGAPKAPSRAPRRRLTPTCLAAPATTSATPASAAGWESPGARQPLPSGAGCPVSPAATQEACPAPEKTKCLGQNRYLFDGTRPRPSASAVRGGMGPPCPGLKNRPWTPITLRPPGDAKVCMVLQTCLQPKTCTVFSYIQNLNTIEEKGHRFPGGAPHPLQHLGQTPPCC
ncbi:unnamed protein product [Eretmochelys imbricata]